MNKLLYGVISLVLLTGLTGCACLKPSYVKKRETAYLHSCAVQPLQVPPGLSGLNIGDDYVIPPLAAPSPEHPVDITPPGFCG